MRLLVTGARGFVGRHLVPALRAAFPEAALALPSFDLRDEGAVQAAVREARPDACIHLAGISNVPEARRTPRLAWDVNLHGTLTLAGALRETVPDCVLVHASTTDAYGASFRRGAPLDEEAPLAPVNLYGATKAAADLALGALAEEGMRVLRLRPCNHTGAGQSTAFALPAFARQIALIEAGRQAPVLKVGNLDAFRDFLDVRDVCAAYIAALARRDGLAPGAILNLASGTPRRIGDVLDALLAVSGVQAEIRIDPARLRPSDIPVAHCDASRARAALGWAPATPWDRTLADLLADARARVASDRV